MNKGLIINEDVWPMIDELEPEEKSDLLTVLSAYYNGEELPEVSRIVKMVFRRIASDNARFDPEHRKAVSEVRAEAGRIGGSKPKQNKQTEANESKISNFTQEKRREDKEEIREDEIREEKNRSLTLPKRASLPPVLDEIEVIKALEDFKAMRKAKKKPMTVRAEELLIKDLMKLSDGDPVKAVDILNQSIANSWTGLYALKDSNMTIAERLAAL